MQSKLDLAWPRADGNAMVAILLGLEDPDGAAAATELIEWCNEVGAPGVLEHYRDILPSGDIAEAASG